MEKPHKRLDAWKLGVELTIDIYRITKTFPDDERFGIISQMRRAAASIPNNIAEGAARQTKKEFINFLCIAQGSLSELDTHLEIAFRLGYLSAGARVEVEAKMLRIDKLVSGLIRSLKTPHPLPLTPHRGKGK
jgi:four helix bundle protein